ncbi:MAG TPA: VWA domain-containing protein [Planctomycetaceae bacterium]|nr:VWA domain-containing protein [Planctomycetaceae bacterium]
MSHSREARWLRKTLEERGLLRFTLPSWAISLCLHFATFLVLLWIFRGQHIGTAAGEVFHEVGLYARFESQQSNTEPGPGTSDSALHADRAIEEASALDAVPETAPDVRLELPTDTAAILGSGTIGRPTTPSEPRDNSKVAATRHPAPATGESGGTGGGATRFFGTAAEGSRFVYVIDSSGSMSNHNAIGVARAELMASVQKLGSDKQFAIIFYDTHMHPMLDAQGKLKYLTATDLHRTLARKFINSVQPDGGTDHLAPLKEALQMAPDAIFFLTDAEEPQLTAGELNQIHQLNKGKAQIHAIEFGKGPPLSVDNFLKKLSRMNGGSYRYWDVTEFRRQ